MSNSLDSLDCTAQKSLNPLKQGPVIILLKKSLYSNIFHLESEANKWLSIASGGHFLANVHGLTHDYPKDASLCNFQVFTMARRLHFVI